MTKDNYKKFDNYKDKNNYNNNNYKDNNNNYKDKNNNYKDRNKEKEIDYNTKKPDITVNNLPNNAESILAATKNNTNTPKKDGAYLSFTYTKDLYEEYKNNFFLALQKLKSSRKTKSVHHLIENDIFGHSIFIGDFQKKIVLIQSKDKILRNIILNASMFDDFSKDSGAVTLTAEIIKLEKEYSNEEIILDERKLINIDKLREKIKDKIKNFIDIFDYQKSIDGLYYGLLRYYATRILKEQPNLKMKLLKYFSDYLTALMTKIIITGTKESHDYYNEKINILMSFFILTYYLKVDKFIAISKLKEAYGNNENFIQLIPTLKSSKITDFDSIVDIIVNAKIVNMSKSYFNSYLLKFLGEKGKNILNDELNSALAFIASLNHKNILFNTVSIDNESGSRIEEILLNGKRDTKFNKPILTFLKFN